MTLRANLLRLTTLVLLTAAAFAGAQTQTFSYTIPAVDVVAASGATSIDLAAPSAGAVIAMGSDSTTTLSLTSNNETGRNISAALDAAMPTGTELVLKPSGGTRTADNLGFIAGTEPTFANQVTLTTTAVNLVTGTGGFQEVAYTGVTLAYELTASLDAAPQTTAASRTITFSVVAN